MPTAKYIYTRGETRILDGTPTTPRFLKIPWIMGDASFALNRPRPPWNLQLNRESFDNYAHYTPGSDAPLAEPVVVTFTVHIDNQLSEDVQAAMSNPFNASPWSVGSSVFVDAMGTGASIYNGAGVLFKPPTMSHDPLHKRVHFEWMFHGAPAGTRDVVFRHEECYCPPELMVITGGDPVAMACTYWVYGKMTRLTAFSAGTDITPALI